jgi:hypothetical protein
MSAFALLPQNFPNTAQDQTTDPVLKPDPHFTLSQLALNFVIFSA